MYLVGINITVQPRKEQLSGLWGVGLTAYFPSLFSPFFPSGSPGAGRARAMGMGLPPPPPLRLHTRIITRTKMEIASSAKQRESERGIAEEDNHLRVGRRWRRGVGPSDGRT